MKKALTISMMFILTGWHLNSQNNEIPAYAEQALNQNFTGFEENKGQFLNTKGKPAADVLYKISANSTDVYITTSGISFVFLKYPEVKEDHYEGYEEDIYLETDGVTGATDLSKEAVEYCRVDMDLKGAGISKNNIIEESPVDPGVTHYYLSHCPEGIRNVRKYKKLTVKSVYKNTDWVLYADPEKGLKHEFVLHPGADPNNIRLEYKWAKDVRVTEEGSKLVIESPFGTIREVGLYCYESEDALLKKSQTKTLSSKYKVKDNEVSFKLSNYDKDNTVVIDPSLELEWATYFGGSSYDLPFGIAADNFGNIFVCGATYSTQATFPTEDPGGSAYHDGSYNGYYDAFILKFNNDCQLLWSTYYGGSDDDEWIMSIATDTTGNVYATGFTESNNFPDKSSILSYNDGSHNGGMDAFLLKFTNDCELLWSTFYGGSGDDVAYSIMPDTAGNIYITGYTTSANFPKLNPAGGGDYYDNSHNGKKDAFIVKFDYVIQSGFHTHSQFWSTFYGGSGDDIGYGMDIDFAGNVYIVGSTTSSDFPTSNPGGGAYYDNAIGVGDTMDAFILKFNNDEEQVWATYYGGSGNEDARCVAADSAGNIFITGRTESGTDFPLFNPGGGAYYDNTLGDVMDLYILKFNTSCQRRWATYFGGGNDWEYVINGDRGITIDPDSGDIYIAFETHSTDVYTKNPGVPNYFCGSAGGGSEEIFLLKFNESLDDEWATYFEGTGAERGHGVILNSAGNLFVTGSGSSGVIDAIDPGGGAYFDDTHNTGFDVILLKFGNNPVPVTLIKFEAKCTDNRYVELVWSTATETNNDFFTIEKSPDGRNFETLENIKGAGNSNVLMNYSFTDFYPYQNKTYYRLKQTDFDGTSVTCKTISAQCAVKWDKLSIINIQPNPAENMVYINIGAPDNTEMTLTLSNSAGQTVLKKTFMIEKGSQTLQLDISQYAEGMYMLNMKSPEEEKAPESVPLVIRRQ